jgi:membrane protease YdiL (CAAX protease family)
MKKASTSTKIYIGLVVVLAILAAVYVYLPQGSFVPADAEAELPVSRPVLALANALIMLVLYGGLGFVGLKLSGRLGFALLWDPAVSNRQRFATPALIGAGVGIFFILVDAVLSRFHTFGPLPHPPFPASLVASAVAGIGEEIMFRLFFISFWVWLISAVILRGRWQNGVFWGVALFSALAFALGHLPSVMAVSGLDNPGQLPAALMVEIILLNGVLSLFAAWYLRKSGFLAAVGIHFWADVVWHVVWGMLS